MLCLIYCNCLHLPCLSLIKYMLYIAASIILLKLASDLVTPVLDIFFLSPRSHYFRKAILHHSITNPAQSPGFYGVTPLPTLLLHHPHWGGTGSPETGRGFRPSGFICCRSCDWHEMVKWITWMAPHWPIKDHPWTFCETVKKDTLPSDASLKDRWGCTTWDNPMVWNTADAKASTGHGQWEARRKEWERLQQT